mmetsp:Transcript_346/g.776  ORF Transcript_346/g.776 Transcript_346/m.776 type:complete len:121 (-) Transcript_346:183-545(-)
MASTHLAPYKSTAPPKVRNRQVRVQKVEWPKPATARKKTKKKHASGKKTKKKKNRPSLGTLQYLEDLKTEMTKLPMMSPRGNLNTVFKENVLRIPTEDMYEERNKFDICLYMEPEKKKKK